MGRRAPDPLRRPRGRRSPPTDRPAHPRRRGVRRHLDGATIGEVLAKLVAEYPGMAGQVVHEDGSLHKFVNIYVNDDDVRYLQGLDTPVPDGAEISILPAVAGG